MGEPRPARQLARADGYTVRQLVERTQNSHVAPAGKDVIERIRKVHGYFDLEAFW
jgi:hypothetical protein